MKVTIADIAKEAKVSPMTVSNVINKRPNVGEETRQKIHDLMRDMNYVPDESAQRLARIQRKGEDAAASITKNFGTIFPAQYTHAEYPFYFEVFDSADKAAIKNGYHMTFIYRENNFIDDPLLCNKMLSRNMVDGVFCIGRTNDIILEKCRSQGIHVVVIGQTEDKNLTSVHFNLFDAATASMRYLYEKGHRKIAYIGTTGNAPRFGGYKTFLQEAGIPYDASIARSIDLKESKVDHASTEICAVLRSGIIPDAVLCSTDLLGLGVMRGIRSMGYSVPKDISVIGINNDYITEYSDPRLTSTGCDKDQLGEIACRSLIELVQGTSAGVMNIDLPAVVHERESVADRT